MGTPKGKARRPVTTRLIRSIAREIANEIVDEHIDDYEHTEKTAETEEA